MPLMIILLPESRVFRQDVSQASRVSTGQALFGEGRGRSTLALWLSYFFTLTVMYMLLNWLPTLLLDQGFSKPQAGIVQMLFNIGGTLGSLLGGLLLDRCNPIKVVLAVYAGLLASLAGIGFSVGIVPVATAGFAVGLFVDGGAVGAVCNGPAAGTRLQCGLPASVRLWPSGVWVRLLVPWPQGRSLPPGPVLPVCCWQPRRGW